MATKTKKVVVCEVYSRIVGYLRPVQNWNKGKQQEFDDRTPYGLHIALARAEVANVGATASA